MQNFYPNQPINPNDPNNVTGNGQVPNMSQQIGAQNVPLNGDIYQNQAVQGQPTQPIGQGLDPYAQNQIQQQPLQYGTLPVDPYQPQIGQLPNIGVNDMSFSGTQYQDNMMVPTALGQNPQEQAMYGGGYVQPGQPAQLQPMQDFSQGMFGVSSAQDFSQPTGQPQMPIGQDIYGNGMQSMPMGQSGFNPTQDLAQNFDMSQGMNYGMPQNSPVQLPIPDHAQNPAYDVMQHLGVQNNLFGANNMPQNVTDGSNYNDFSLGQSFDGGQGAFDLGAQPNGGAGGINFMSQGQQAFNGQQQGFEQNDNDPFGSNEPKSDIFDQQNKNEVTPFSGSKFDQTFGKGKRGNFKEAVSEDDERPVQPKRPVNQANNHDGSSFNPNAPRNKPPARPGSMQQRPMSPEMQRGPRPNPNPNQKPPDRRPPSNKGPVGQARPQRGAQGQQRPPMQRPPLQRPPQGGAPTAQKQPPQINTPITPPTTLPQLPKANQIQKPKVDIAEIQSKLEQAVVIADFDKIFTQNNLFKFPDRSYINIREATSKYLLSSSDDEGIPVFSNVTANFPVSSCTVVTSEDEATKYAIAKLVGTGLGLANGDMLINGNEVRSKSIMQEVLYIDDDSMVPDRMTVFDFLMQCIAKVQTDDEVKIQKLTEILEKLGLDNVADDTMKLFSTARKIMVLLIAATQNPLIRCVVINFRKLLLEPEDEVRMMKVFEMLRLRDITVIMNDCNDILSSNLPNRVLALKEGEVAFNGVYREFIEKYCEEIMTFESNDAEKIEKISKAFENLEFSTDNDKVTVKGKGADASVVENVVVELSNNEIDLKTVRLGVRSFVLGRKELVK